jgi:hypothetical protein
VDGATAAAVLGGALGTHWGGAGNDWDELVEALEAEQRLGPAVGESIVPEKLE